VVAVSPIRSYSKWYSGCYSGCHIARKRGKASHDEESSVAALNSIATEAVPEFARCLVKSSRATRCLSFNDASAPFCPVYAVRLSA